MILFNSLDSNLNDNCRFLTEASGAKPKDTWEGVISVQTSTSALINHIRSLHPEDLPDEVSPQRKKGVGDQIPPNADLMKDWAAYMVFGAMLPVRLVKDRYVRSALAGRLKGLGGEAPLRNAMSQVEEQLRSSVRESIASAKEKGARFVLSGDTWKPKMKRRRHFLAVHLNWTSEAWSICSACIHVCIADAPRTGERYKQWFTEALAAVGLTTDDLLCTMSDHESALRCGLRLLGKPTVGCSCHAIQLGCKHALPSLRSNKKKKNKVPAGSDDSSESSDSDTSSSSSSDSSSSEESEVKQQQPQGPAPKPRGRKPDEAAAAMRQMLEAPFKRYRTIVKWFAANDDAYNQMVDDAKQGGLEMCAFAHETPTRWSSGLGQLVTVIRNTPAHALTRTGVIGLHMLLPLCCCYLSLGKFF